MTPQYQFDTVRFSQIERNAYGSKRTAFFSKRGTTFLLIELKDEGQGWYPTGIWWSSHGKIGDMKHYKPTENECGMFKRPLQTQAD